MCRFEPELEQLTFMWHSPASSCCARPGPISSRTLFDCSNAAVMLAHHVPGAADSVAIRAAYITAITYVSYSNLYLT